MKNLTGVIVWWLGKTLQAMGLVVVATGFLIRFPALMSPRVLFVGLSVFGLGYIIERSGRWLNRI